MPEDRVYRMYHVESVKAGVSGDYKSYEIIDLQDKLLFKSKGIDATIKPLVGGKIVDRPIHVGDIVQVVHRDSSGGIQYRILEVRTLDEQDFKQIQTETERDNEEYQRQEQELQRKHETEQRKLYEKHIAEKAKLPQRPAGLERRLVSTLFGADRPSGLH